MCTKKYLTNSRWLFLSLFIVMITLSSALAVEEYFNFYVGSTGTHIGYIEAVGVNITVGPSDVLLKEIITHPDAEGSYLFAVLVSEPEFPPSSFVYHTDRVSNNQTVNWHLLAGQSYIIGIYSDPYATFHVWASPTFPMVGSLVRVNNYPIIGYLSTEWEYSDWITDITELVFVEDTSLECGAEPFTGCIITDDTTFTPGDYMATNITVIGSGTSGDPLVISFNGSTVRWPGQEDNRIFSVLGDYIVIQDGAISGNYTNGTYFYHGSTGIWVDQDVVNLTIRDMVFRDNAFSIDAQGVSELLVKENYFYGESVQANEVYLSSDGLIFEYNFGYQQPMVAQIFGDNVVVRNNVGLGYLFGCDVPTCGETKNLSGLFQGNIITGYHQKSQSGAISFTNNTIYFVALVYGNGIDSYLFFNNYFGPTGSVFDDTSLGDYITYCVGGQGNYFDTGTTYLGPNPYNGTCPPGCVESWQPHYSACTVGDNQTLTYIDTNACGTYDDLPGDNNTIVGCNYCTLAYTQTLGPCVGNIQEVFYTYTNYETCCALTGLPSDCVLPMNRTQTCGYQPTHESNQITGVVIDNLVELGRSFLGYVPLIALIMLGIALAGYLGFRSFNGGGNLGGTE